jgi:hypothetical protein
MILTRLEIVPTGGIDTYDIYLHPLETDKSVIGEINGKFVSKLDFEFLARPKGLIPFINEQYISQQSNKHHLNHDDVLNSELLRNENLFLEDFDSETDFSHHRIKSPKIPILTNTSIIPYIHSKLTRKNDNKIENDVKVEEQETPQNSTRIFGNFMKSSFLNSDKTVQYNNTSTTIDTTNTINNTSNTQNIQFSTVNTQSLQMNSNYMTTNGYFSTDTNTQTIIQTTPENIPKITQNPDIKRLNDALELNEMFNQHKIARELKRKQQQEKLDNEKQAKIR